MTLSEEIRAARVVLAQDVLAALKNERIVAIYDSYFVPFVPIGGLTQEEEEEEEEAMYTPPKYCGVCAIGAFFITAVDRHNALKLRDVRGIGEGETQSGFLLMRYLKQWFTVEDLRLMEVAFEGHRIEPILSSTLSKEQIQRAVEWHNRQHDKHCGGSAPPEAIMSALMLNIIGNNGVFDPQSLE